jgi:hypothetical protein
MVFDRSPEGLPDFFRSQTRTMKGRVPQKAWAAKEMGLET